MQTKQLNLALLAVSGFSLAGCNGGAGNTTGSSAIMSQQAAINATVAAIASAPAPSCTGIPSWSSTTVYSAAGNVVVYNGVEYKNNWWTEGNNPATSNGGSGSGQPWTIVTTCTGSPTPTPSSIPSSSPIANPSPTPVPSQTPTPVVSSTPVPNPSGVLIYPASINSYVVGTVVQGSDGRLYSCYIPGWCNQNNWAYTPATGSYWSSAWNLVSAPTPTPSATPSPIPSPTASITPTPVPTISPIPTVTPVPVVSPTPAPIGSVVFSPYKDVTINANWNTLVMSTVVGSGSITPLLSVLPGNVKTVTWAFATGECGSETWGGMNATQFATANVQPYVNANKKYIISTGGAAGVFTCSSNAGMQAFLNRYMSANLIGLDFDIEGGQTQAGITSLVNELVYAKSLYPNLRISFTLATLADSSGAHGGLNTLGYMVVKTAKAAGLDFYVNLMTMDYGAALAVNCLLSGGVCEMALSAEQAVSNLQYTYGIAANRIEVTPMIGNNDTSNEIFTLADAQALANYVVTNKLAGYHFWSLDRDTPCASSGSSSPTCTYTTGENAWSFSNTIGTYFP